MLKNRNVIGKIQSQDEQLSFTRALNPRLCQQVKPQ